MKNKRLSKIIKIISITSVSLLFSFYAYSYYNSSAMDRQSAEQKIVQSLLDSLKDGDKHAQAEALLAMTDLGKRAVNPLISAFEDESLQFRRRAADALISIGDPAVEPLIKALAADHQKTRRSAAFALEKGNPDWSSSDEAISEIPELMLSLTSSDESLRDDAVNMLSKIGEPAIAPLLTALSDKKWYVREASISALGKIKSTDTVLPLVDMLEDNHWQVRRSAAFALGKIESNQAIIPLRSALKDVSAEVKTAANKSLKRLAMLVEEPIVGVE